ncbi:MAG: 2,3-diphosphoglycerate-dependent phosphoglycerate mutase [Acidimicrobiales bacterium]
MATLVLLRHGQSVMNRDNRYTGWQECDLSELGEDESRQAGRLMDDAGLRFGLVHTSLQLRAIRTANLSLQVMDQLWLPVRRHWRLNERHYGALEGLDKIQTAAEHGAEQVRWWRRSWDHRPPPVSLDDRRHPRHDRRYAALATDVLPVGECLKDVVTRILPYWHDRIVPDLHNGQPVLIAAHGNSLRGLVKHLKGIADHDIPNLEIPTGVPWVFELGPSLEVVSDRLLGDQEDIARRADETARQAEIPTTA